MLYGSSSPILTLDPNHQVLLYDSIDAYIADCKSFHSEVASHVVTAVDYKDNATLLEDLVNKMAAGTLRNDGERACISRPHCPVWPPYSTAAAGPSQPPSPVPSPMPSPVVCCTP